MADRTRSPCSMSISMARSRRSRFPVSLGRIEPGQRELRGDILCVVNQDQDPGPSRPVHCRITRRSSVGPTGRLSDPAGGVLARPRSSPTQAPPAPDGEIVFGCDFLGGTLRTFKLGARRTSGPAIRTGAADRLCSRRRSPGLASGVGCPPQRPLLYVGLVTINHIAVYQLH